MALNAKTLPKTNSKSKAADPLDAGSYPGRLVQLIDYGMQEQQPYKGQAKPPAHEIGFTYELSDEFMKDDEGNDIEDKPRWVSETFPFNSLDKDLATSTKRYKALDPTDSCDGDFPSLIGAAGMISIIQKPSKDGTKIYNNVAGVASVRAKDEARMPPLVNPPVVFLLDDPDLEVFNNFPEFIQDKIKKNLNYQGSALQKLLGGSPKATKAKANAAPAPEPEEPLDEGTDDSDKGEW